MANKVSSNNPFKRQCNLRAGTGPVYVRSCPPTNTANNQSRGTFVKKESCFGQYDNLVNYVWEVDVTNGNHLAYVDCDYVG